MSKNLLEVREYKFEQVTIWVRLDRRAKTLSFVEWNDEAKDYLDKDWLFAGRKLGYMNGWVHILQAMQYVINDCKPAMESWDEEETDQLIRILTGLSAKSGKKQ